MSSDERTPVEGHRAERLAPRRRLSREEFAFLRGVVQGLPLDTLWARYLYLEGKMDARRARNKVAALKEAFRAAAQRAARPRIARLVRLDLSKVAASSAPSLEEFAAQFPEGFYTEQELVDLWAAEYGRPARAEQRRARLIAKQLEAITWLESVVATDPVAGDGVAAWFDPKTAERLASADCIRLKDLIERIHDRGRRWWVGVPGIGPETAARLVAWLTEHAAVGGWTMAPEVGLPRSALEAIVRTAERPLETAVVPLERFGVPADLDGSAGTFRAPRERCLIGAENDYAAIAAWLASRRGTHTWRSYRKEAERLLLWATLVRGKALSSLNVEDATAYQAFLEDPQPRERWCAPRGCARWGARWRPFEGPLNAASLRQALTVVQSLFSWLIDQCYLVGNPWKALGPLTGETPKLQVGRSFSQDQWAFLMEQLDTYVETGALRRLRFALTFAYATGLRLAELVQARAEDLAWVEFGAGAGGWMLAVRGKGGKLREVPVPEEVMTDLANYLADRSLDPDPRAASNEGVFLLGKVDDVQRRLHWAEGYDARQGISAATLYDQFKLFFQEAAEVLSRSDPRGAARLNRASTHWLRHTHGSHAVAAGTPIEVVQANLGHASLATTTRYVTAEAKRRHQAIQAFWRGRGGGVEPS